jgi:hypothetical protein
MKKLLEFGGNVLQKGENPVVRLFISESVEYKIFCSYESISIGWNPIFGSNRLGTP